MEGAENSCDMIHSLLGKGNSGAGSDLYFTVMMGKPLPVMTLLPRCRCFRLLTFTQFKRWYLQAAYSDCKRWNGLLWLQKLAFTFDNWSKDYRQQRRATNQATIAIPITCWFIGWWGNALFSKQSTCDQKIMFYFLISNNKFRFWRLTARPVPSLLRGFSLPSQTFDMTRPPANYFAYWCRLILMRFNRCGVLAHNCVNELNTLIKAIDWRWTVSVEFLS